jgi:hypothetical protein
MKINRETRDKLRRYLINADPFLWNVLEAKNKKGRIQELKALGFLQGYTERGAVNYSRINQDLLVDPGVEGILERIVVPRVKTLFSPDVLDYFRRCWEQGQTPPLSYFKQHRLYRRHLFTSVETYDDWAVKPVAGYKEQAFVFVEIDTQQSYVERWSTFAAVWFEEIEPLLGSTLNAGSADTDA